MKTIKDAIQASSIEQRRRILNNLGIDKDSKNFIVSGKASQANGGDSDKIEYFKFKEPIRDIDELFKYLMSTVAFENEPVKGIVPYGIFGGGMVYNTILGFAFCDYAVNTGTEYIKAESVKQYLIIMSNPDITGIPNPDDIPDTIYEDFGIIPITKEEYYDLIK